MRQNISIFTAITSHRQAAGFTLLEMLLVLVIVSVIIAMGLQYGQQKTLSLQIDRTVFQMQYIMNAGLAYYVANGTWPGVVNSVSSTCGGTGCADPLTPNFSPPRPIINVLGTIARSQTTYYSYGYTDAAYVAPNTALFSASVNIPGSTLQVYGFIGTTSKQQAIGSVIAGRLPGGYFDPTTGIVSAYVNIPGQNLNNASAINFAGLYHHGACVPLPVCPANTTPQIFVVPVSVSGVFDAYDNSTVYPLTSFTAYATSPAASPASCTSNPSDAVSCSPTQGSAPLSGRYWRVCLQVLTTKGDLDDGIPGSRGTQNRLTYSDSWGQMATLAAFTRCAITNEPAGSTFSVYSN